MEVISANHFLIMCTHVFIYDIWIEQTNEKSKKTKINNGMQEDKMSAEIISITYMHLKHWFDILWEHIFRDHISYALRGRCSKHEGL